MRATFMALLALGVAAPAVWPAQTSDELEAKFQAEPDLMHRARMLAEMSKVSFRSITQQVEAGDNTDALKALSQLRDDVQHTSDQLDAKEKNPENHPGGFKQLQIATRECLRRIDDLMVGLPGDEQEPFAAIRKDFDQLNRHLIRELFPHQPPPPESEPEKKR